MPAEPVREVVAGVDLRDPAPVINLAAAEAVLRSASLTVVHACADARAGAVPSEVARVRAVFPALLVRTETLAGDPATALAARASSASLIVMEYGRRATRSLAAAVLTRTSVPILICPRRAAGGAGPVVVGVDGTPASEAVLRFGFTEADLRHASLTAVHLWPPLTRRACGTSAAEDNFLDLLTTWSGKYPDVPVRICVRHGVDAAIVLAATSRSARLLVVEAAAGPVLAALADRAACPIAAVPDMD